MTLEDDARACFEAALRTVDPFTLARDFLREHPLRGTGPVTVVGVGKAVCGLARGALAALGDRVVRGILVTPRVGDDHDDAEPLELRVGGHPLPDETGVAAAREIHALVSSLGEADQLLVLLSGGGSALLTLPPDGVSLEDLRFVTDALLRAGASIGELNSVRKHLDQLKGGRLARLAARTPATALVLSDVIGDPLDAIASGPVSPDPTTVADAVDVLRRFLVWEKAPAAVREHLERASDESPKPGDPCFERVESHIIGNLRMAAAGARTEARRRGYEVHLGSLDTTGEAREVGRALGRRARDLRTEPRPVPLCAISGGETTVTVVGNGRGGRNHELALSAAVEIAGLEGVLIASLGTDGVDGSTKAAGAFASGSTVSRARSLGLDAAAALASNDSGTFFAKLGDAIVTGSTGTNVMDLQLVLISNDATQQRPVHGGASSPAVP